MDIDLLRSDDLAAAVGLLASNDLPTDDLHDPSITLFAAKVNDVPVGVVGLQRCDEVGLLRSLAVAPSARSTGIGGRLCDRVLAAARECGYDDVYLLTTSARDYFARRGFSVVARDAAPSAIRSTSQFSSLCPSTAVLMMRST